MIESSSMADVAMAWERLMGEQGRKKAGGVCSPGYRYRVGGYCKYACTYFI